jgi:hypothetical protein
MFSVTIFLSQDLFKTNVCACDKNLQTLYGTLGGLKTLSSINQRVSSQAVCPSKEPTEKCSRD